MSQIERTEADRSVVTITLDNGVVVMVTSNRDSLNVSFVGIEPDVSVYPVRGISGGCEPATAGNTFNLQYRKRE